MMRFPSRLAVPLALSSVMLLAAAGPEPLASCRKSGGFAVYQCGDRAWFDAPPPGTGSITALFWQIGYGNALINNGSGTGGVGIAPPGVFSGNDSGLFTVSLVDARKAIGDDRVPEGALCLGPANWENVGIDGCCDNARDPDMQQPMDGLLNPLFEPRSLIRLRSFEATGARIQDYPLGVLLREETLGYFAVAAVATMERSGLEDVRQGHYTLADVKEGGLNPLSGAKNVVPWQKAPEARVEMQKPLEGDLWRLKVVWDPVRVPGDATHRPSEAFEMDTPGHGVGVADMGPLVTYEIQKVRLIPTLIDASGYPMREVLPWERSLLTGETSAEVDLEADACLRVVVHLGLVPRTRSASAKECSLGHCGDVGYLVAGPPVCRKGPLLK